MGIDRGAGYSRALSGAPDFLTTRTKEKRAASTGITPAFD
jgi:hypothetical protein